MSRNKFPIFLFIIVGLALLGVGYRLLTDPKGFLITILGIVGFAALIFAVAYLMFFRNRGSISNSDEMKKYKAAVKQSKQKYQQPKPNKAVKSANKKQAKTVPLKRKSQRRKINHLRVIEGNKTDKKKRATN
ncbi:MAG TPA: hypothetical protein IAA78_09345 [Candidatus Avamphibacillus intestinigallinarum]|nr:hypothetical protein [Candidatus Avamphibacillus intestinigallinarum]